MKLEIEVCDHCGRKPKAGLRAVNGTLSNTSPLPSVTLLDCSALLCRACQDRVQRFMERGFTAKK